MTISNRIRNNRRRLPKALLSLAVLALSILWACHLGPDDAKDTFDIAGDTAWTHCDTVTVVLLDSAGAPVDTLFNQPLSSLSQLEKLDAEKYPGGKGGIEIKGRLDGGVCFEQKRTFEKPNGPVVVDTLRDPSVSPKSIAVKPDSLVLTIGSPAANLNASVVPDYADPAILWSVDESGVVSLEGLASGKGNPARVKPLKAGKATVTARSAKDTSISIAISVRVVSTSTGGIKLSKDEVLLYVQGPSDSLSVTVPEEYAGQKVEWKTGHPDIASIDASGRIKPLKEGETTVQATLTPSGLSDVAVVKVVRDIPVLTVASKSGAAVNAPIVFSPTVVQKFGTLVLYKWDLSSDGEWDDSLTTGWNGDTVNLPAVTAKYAKSGSVVAKFHVRDSEGNVAEAQVLLDIGNQAPEITALRNDTTISVKDSIGMSATARDADGKVAWVGWDYEGDGQYDDTLAVSDSASTFARGHRFQEAGTYLAIFKALDDNGKARLDTARIKVEFDEPVADAGPDFTVIAGAAIDISAKGTDKYGSIAKRELKVGAGAFVALSKQDTTFPAPSTPTVLKCIVRVTDDDGLSDVDTVEVTVILSANADLSDLTFSAGPLDPVFKPNTTFYAARVAFADSMVTVTPKATAGGTKITVNAKATASGSPSDPVKLNLGSNINVFQIIVTAEDGSQRVYSVSVTRDPNGEATLSKLEAPGFILAPVFSPTTLEYADTVGYTDSVVTFKPTVASAGASLAFNDTSMTSGTFTSPQALKFGENSFTFAVTAQDGKTRTVYTVKVVRLGRLYVFRKVGDAAPVLQDSVDAPVGSSRPLIGGSVTGFKFTRWTLLQGAADLADSAADPTTITLKSGVVKAQAALEILKFTLTATATGCGKVDPGSLIVDYGTTREYKITPDSGCRIQSVKVDGVEEPSAFDSSYVFQVVTQNRTIQAHFIRTYRIATGIDKVFPNGKISPANPVVDSGSPVTLTFTADANYKVSTLCDAGNCQSYSATTYKIDAVTQARNFLVSFKRAFRMTGSIGAGKGTISPLDSIVDSAATVVWRFFPDPGYRFVLAKYEFKAVTPWEKDSTIIATNEGGAISDHHVTVGFRRQYPMTLVQSPNGVLSADGLKVDSAGTVLFTASPNPNYRVDTLFVDDKPVATSGFGPYLPQSYTLTPVDGPHTIRAVYKRYFEVTVNMTGKGAVNPLSGTKVDSGGSMDFVFSPTDASLELSSLTDDGVAVAIATNPASPVTHTVKDVVAPKTLAAVYSTRQFTLTISGRDVCLYPTCPPGSICKAPFCPLGLSTTSATVQYGAQWTMLTAGKSAEGGPFINWSCGFRCSLPGNPASVTTNSNLSYSATYEMVIGGASQ